VLIRLLDTVSTMAPMVHTGRLPALRDHAELVHATAVSGSFVRGDLEDIDQRYTHARAAIDARLASA
jgi:hypothetical protein